MVLPPRSGSMIRADTGRTKLHHSLHLLRTRLQIAVQVHKWLRSCKVSRLHRHKTTQLDMDHRL